MSQAQALGAYGLRIRGLSGVDGVLVPAPDTWPDWRFEREPAPGRDDGGDGRSIDRDGASIDLDGGGRLEVHRAAAVARLSGSRHLPDGALVHPYLSAVAALASRWDGAPSFHCGGLVHDGGVWGVLGERERGKSTLLASLDRRGMPVMSDDLLVLRDGLATAGPRCVDLREDAARHTGLGDYIGVVGGRARWRVALEPVPAEAPLAGWVVLGWGERVAARPVPAADRLPTLLANLTIVPPPRDAARLLELAALPMVELVRPRDLGALDAAGDALSAALGR